MSRISHSLSLLVVGLSAVGFLQPAAAGDHFRKAGIGYGAGYHAPAACGSATTCEKLHSYHYWKDACYHPGPTLPHCGCAPSVKLPCFTLPSIAPPAGWFGNSSCGCGTRLSPNPALN